MDDSEPFDEPSKVKVTDGAVKVRGPDDVDVELTPAAAVETSDRLLDAAMKARGNRRLKDLPHQPE